MKPNQLHETDIATFSKMSLEEAVRHLDGKSVFFNTLGFDVKYSGYSRPDKKPCILATVSDHYTHTHPHDYVLNLVPNTQGQEIFTQTYAALASYIKRAKLHDEPRPKKIRAA